MNFPFFDREQGVAISCRNLPHWYQPGVTYFITFRTDDSLPAAVLDRWWEERRQWLRSHQIDPGGP